MAADVQPSRDVVPVADERGREAAREVATSGASDLVRLYEAGDSAAVATAGADRARAQTLDEGESVAYVRALANLGRLEEGGRACVGALELHRTSAELHYVHAVLLAENGKLEEAAAAARRAVYLDRGLAVAHLALGVTLARAGQNENARRALANAERLLEALPADAPVPASDRQPAARLTQIARAQRQLLERET
jgi:chemotaxis protein methyltransferase CheR